MVESLDVAVAEMTGKFDQIMQKLETMKERQEEMADDIAKIKHAVYHPDEGLYARLRALESWKATSTRLLWITITASISLGVMVVWSSISGI